MAKGVKPIFACTHLGMVCISGPSVQSILRVLGMLLVPRLPKPLVKVVPGKTFVFLIQKTEMTKQIMVLEA